MALTRSNQPLVWIDCEMTGLDPETDHILQISCFLTDADLNLLEPRASMSRYTNRSIFSRP
ncbi:oligoribonuclease [Coccidioides immitis RMSCC 3703]|uniref:Oligoribonuclease n=1 Tax=Coccidioides immitis RMSCC 3703 TaxID=454286 RepID=A0A0J8R4T2_COCIT|nr:oligoribonuclease [Coccidioides immitis RMSCC 3703]